MGCKAANEEALAEPVAHDVEVGLKIRDAGGCSDGGASKAAMRIVGIAMFCDLDSFMKFH
jgi:hypothetical protein